LFGSGAPERIRTSDPQIRSLVLYPAELRAPRPVARGNGGKALRLAGLARHCNRLMRKFLYFSGAFFGRTGMRA